MAAACEAFHCDELCQCEILGCFSNHSAEALQIAITLPVQRLCALELGKRLQRNPGRWVEKVERTTGSELEFAALDMRARVHYRRFVGKGMGENAMWARWRSGQLIRDQSLRLGRSSLELVSKQVDPVNRTIFDIFCVNPFHF